VFQNVGVQNDARKHIEKIRFSTTSSSFARNGGRHRLISSQVREMKKRGLGATEIAKSLGIGRASVYRVLEACHNSQPSTVPMVGGALENT
jgi:DNA invertase Pin-like site-specific DNA recombinase